jgi:hypothetical protein
VVTLVLERFDRLHLVEEPDMTLARFGFRLSVWIVVLVLGFSTRMLWAQDSAGTDYAKEIDQAAEKVAASILKLMGDETDVFVQPFRVTGGSDIDVSRRIAGQLTKANKKIKSGAPFEVEGRLFPLKAEDDKPRGMVIRATLTDTRRQKEQPITVEVNNDNEIDRVWEGVRYRAPVQDALPPQSDLVIDESGRVYPSSGYPYSVQILVKTGPNTYTPAPTTAYVSGGEKYAKVDLQKGQTYMVRVFNKADLPVAVALSIDGVRRYALSEDSRYRDALDLLKSGQEVCDLRGYFRDLRHINEFVVGDVEGSVAQQMGIPTPQVGIITVSFRAAWQKGGSRPPYEPFAGLRRRSGDLATHLGALVDEETQVVENTEVGAIRAAVKIRYGDVIGH